MNHSDVSKFCGTSEYMKHVLSTNTTWKRELDEANREWTNDIESRRGNSGKPTTGIEIPIIWHNLVNSMNDEVNNVPDECIAYQIEAVNQDFNGKNEDLFSGTPEEFLSVMNDGCNIAFKLDRVIRKISELDFSIFVDRIKSTEFGGSDPIEPQKKLNIWTGPIVYPESYGAETSYSSKPGGDWKTDGVVLISTDICPMKTYGYINDYNLGRWGTHQIGHYLGLEHIWGDHPSCVNTGDISDYLLDTPMQTGPTLDCPEVNSRTRSCLDNPYSQDMFMNFMDITCDRRRVMFTRQQCNRMWFMINKFRKELPPNQNGKEVAHQPYVSWIYFRRFDVSSNSKFADNDICFGDDDILFYDDSLNKGSSSNISIYGCLQTTTNARISPITDIKIIYGNDTICNEEYTQSSQDLNEGNNGDSIHLCYFKQDSVSNHENMAILDMTLIENNDTSKLNMNNGWSVDLEHDINPLGVTLNFAVKKGKYYAMDSIDLEVNDEMFLMNIIILIVVFLFTIVSIFIVVYFIIKQRNNERGKSQLLSEENAYGTITELSHIVHLQSSNIDK